MKRMPPTRFACVFAAVFAILATTSGRAQSATPWQKRRQVNQQIKAMHITKRPDRPGHLYGNTVRRVYRRTDGRVNLNEVLRLSEDAKPAKIVPALERRSQAIR